MESFVRACILLLVIATFMSCSSRTSDHQSFPVTARTVKNLTAEYRRAYPRIVALETEIGDLLKVNSDDFFVDLNFWRERAEYKHFIEVDRNLRAALGGGQAYRELVLEIHREHGISAYYSLLGLSGSETGMDAMREIKRITRVLRLNLTPYAHFRLDPVEL